MTIQTENKYLIHGPLTETVTLGNQDAEVSISYYCDLSKLAGKVSYIFYVTGTAMERIGTASDEEIITSLIGDGYAVVVCDFGKNAAAVCPDLDWTVQGILNRLVKGDLIPSDCPLFGKKGKEHLLLPSGYSISKDHVFWSFDLHGADGTIEKTVEIWNHDFRSYHGEKLVRWVGSNGKRKTTANGYDGSEPVWLDSNGTPSENGEYVKVKHAYASCIDDCVRPDGSPISLDLGMNIYYPVRPKKDVPVMCLVNSGHSKEECPLKKDRPHFHGFLLQGYAGIVYDYGYTPMARLDHYKYFHGTIGKKGLTGDSVTYSLQFYNDTAINTAAMRYIRYIGATDKRFCFLPDSIGVIGNSKGGWTAFLGEKDPETHVQHRFFEGHHGESRYEAGKTKACGIVRGAEPQPHLTLNGEPISSRVNFTYAGCGGSNSDIFGEHTPMYISHNLDDGTAYDNSSWHLALCRRFDIACVDSCIEAGHTLCSGVDVRHGFDSYLALFLTANHYLKGDAPTLLYFDCDRTGAIIKFTGTVKKEDLCGLLAYDSEGRELCTELCSAFGGTEWHVKAILGDNHGESEKVTLCLPTPCGEQKYEYVQKKDTSPAFKGYRSCKNITECDTVAGDLIRANKTVAPDGTPAISAYTPINVYQDGNPQYIVSRFYTNNPIYLEINHMNKIKVERIFGDEAFDSGDDGRHFTIKVSLYDTACRDLQLVLTSGFDMENKVVDFNKAITNVKTKKGEWMVAEFDYTVSAPYEKTPKALYIGFTSTGDSEKEIFFGDIEVIEG